MTKPEYSSIPGILVDLDKAKLADAYGANGSVVYFAPLFPTTHIEGNIPVLSFTGFNQFILFELTMPPKRVLNRYNYMSLTSYFYSYQDVAVFAPVDQTISFFDFDFTAGTTYRFIFTFSKPLADYFNSIGYIASRMPSDYSLDQITYQFLLRIGTPGPKVKSLLKYSKVSLNTITNDFDINPLFISTEIMASQPQVLGSSKSPEVVTTMKKIYNNIVKKISKKGIQIPTYLYLSNLPNPPVDYAFETFYESITVTPYIQEQATNTQENYYNTNFIDLTQYRGRKLVIVACNMHEFGYGLTSNIQIYNSTTLSLITNGFYNTSAELPNIGTKNYPYQKNNPKKFPLISIKKYNINKILKDGDFGIICSERNSYGQINFNHSNYNEVPKFSVFII